MKNLIRTTTGVISSKMILYSCGDMGEFGSEAFNVLSQVTNMHEYKENEWADLMYNGRGEVFAIWAEDGLTCQNADAIYIQLDEADCPEAFRSMNEKREN